MRRLHLTGIRFGCDRFNGERQTGELLTRLSKDTADMEPFMAHDIPDIIVNLSMLVGISAILFSLGVIMEERGRDADARRPWND